MIKKRIIFVIVLAILVGCMKIPVVPSNSSTPTETLPTISTIPVKTSIPTETNGAPLPTATNSPTDKCLDIESNKLGNVESTGTVVLSGTVDIGNGLVRYTGYKINMETREKLEFSTPEENVFDISVSPDGKWMAYTNYALITNSYSLIISDSSGKEQVKSWEIDWTYISSWLDDQKLLIGIDVTTSGEASQAQPGSTFAIFNPFTNQQQILYPNFPNIYDDPLHSIWPGSGLGITAYNSLLDRVVYLQGGVDGAGTYNYILWDIDQQHRIASFDVVIQAYAIPRWSADGTKFALAPSLNIENLQQKWPLYELFSVSRDGQVTQLTDLTSYYPWVYIDDYSWSPDGRYIAFWFSWWADQSPGYDGLPGERYLAVVDTENNVVTNYCIPGELQNNGRVLPPVWSPNSEQLVVESPYLEAHSQVLLIDLESQRAIQIAEDMQPVGWMVAP